MTRSVLCKVDVQGNWVFMKRVMEVSRRTRQAARRIGNLHGRWTLELRIPSLAMSCLIIWHDVGRANVGNLIEATFPLQDPIRRNISRGSCTSQQSKYTTKHIDALAAGTRPKLSEVSSLLRQRAEMISEPAGLFDGAHLSFLASREGKACDALL